MNNKIFTSLLLSVLLNLVRRTKINVVTRHILTKSSSQFGEY
jgi:hypothetical protein